MAHDLVLKEKLSDVILKVRRGGYSWRMPAHSLVLRRESSRFDEMINERPEDEWPKVLTIVDMSAITATAILRYLYLKEYPREFTTDLILAAEKYGLHSLRDHLENLFMNDLTVSEACIFLEELITQQPCEDDCALKQTCFSVIENHALLVFASDMVLVLNKQALQRLLCSDCLNVPDDAVVFWGIWRWGHRHCMRTGRPITEKDVITYIHDLLALIRCSNLLSHDGIPSSAIECFDHCSKRRTRYAVPQDILKQSCVLRLTPTWDDIVELGDGKKNTLCLQISFDRDVMLTGITFEIYAKELLEAYVQIFRELDGVEIKRQRFDCCRKSVRKLSPGAEPVSVLEVVLVLKLPLFIVAGSITSIYMNGRFENSFLPTTTIKTPTLKVESTNIRLHGEAITAIRELHLVSDVNTSWGPRGFD